MRSSPFLRLYPLVGPVLAVATLSCSSSSSPATPPSSSPDASAEDAAPVDASVAIDAYAGPVTEHGIMVDYTTKMPVSGLTVTDNGVSATTDSTGAWSLMIPAGSTLSPTVTGPSYSHLLFPQSLPAAADVDYGTAVDGSSSIFQVEQEGLTNDTSKALIQVVVVTAPTCASSVGGTLTVLDPPGTTTVYFSATTLPDNSLTSFQAVETPRPVAVIYNVTPGATLDVQMNHPTCTAAPFPFTYQGKTYTGVVPTMATEPGDYNSAMVLMLE